MTEPLIFVDRRAIRPGRAQELTTACERIVDVLQSNPTRHLYFALCINAQGTAFHNVQVHPDAASLAEHLKLVSEDVQSAGELLDPVDGEEDLFGRPTPKLRDLLAEWGTRTNDPAEGFSRVVRAETSSSVLAPLVVVTCSALKEGGADDYRDSLAEWIARNESDHTGVLHHKVYLNRDRMVATDLQVHADARSVEEQLPWFAKVHKPKLMSEARGRTVRLVGRPPAALLDELWDTLGAGVPVTVTEPTVGFSRLAPA